MNKKKRVLTGITTTGTPHLGNYVGAIKPAIEASFNLNNDAFYFLADYHALVKCDDAKRVQQSRLELAATWLACGLNHEEVTFYRQSDIHEIPELAWLLTCVSAKGLLNRAHAYKAAVAANQNASSDPDASITMGLFCYPILMAADILMFNANLVPVGHDQIQHIEMARDMAMRFNHLYEQELFVLPEALITENSAVLPGLDGRKMSKSYNNTLPLFADENSLKKLISKIITDSAIAGQSKDPTQSNIFKIYSAIANDNLSRELACELQNGLSWNEAKQRLFALLNEHFAQKRERYFSLLNKPQELEDILQAGASKARKLSVAFMEKLRDAVGLRNFNQTVVTSLPSNKSKTNKEPRWLSFREDGKFYFKLLDESGNQLLISNAFADGKSAGIAQKAIKNGESFLLDNKLFVNDELIAITDKSDLLAKYLTFK